MIINNLYLLALVNQEIFSNLIRLKNKKVNAPGGDRTHDLRVTWPVSSWREAYKPVIRGNNISTRP